MAEQSTLNIIARIHSDFPTKFGIPRQSGLVEELRSTVVFEPEDRNPDALRGLEGFSHLWLIWQFSQAVREDWSPTVRPPRLGGNTRMGVFATRSPFRPNPIGLSCVGLAGVELHTPQGPVLRITGADLMDGTPILDIKPYLPYTDSHPEATGGWTDSLDIPELSVCSSDDITAKLETIFSSTQIEALKEILAQDPRPGYQDEPNRRYGMLYGGYDIRFTISGDTLTICEVAEPGPQ